MALQIKRVFKIAVSPRVATSWCLGIIVFMAATQFALIDPIPAPIAVAHTAGNLLGLLALKLMGGVMCSLVFRRDLESLPRFVKAVVSFFMGGEREKLPLVLMVLLAVFLFIAAAPLMIVSLIWHINNNAVPGLQ